VQSFGNVMTNAAKYTQAGGTISIHIGSSNDSVKVEISDTGAGISAEFMPRIFDLFAQADRTLDRAQGGLGIGLSVVKKLVEMHGGRISARSEGLGRGSTFEFILPGVEPPTPAMQEERDVSVISRRELVVDDNADAANTLAELLRMDGHQAQPAFSAEEALSLAQSFNPDVVLLDIGLPRMDGYEVARRLRHSLLRKGAMLIALTGSGQAEDRERAHSAGFDAHLVKPVDLAALAKLLAAG
jgi:CheY-like chemotaxis protein